MPKDLPDQIQAPPSLAKNSNEVTELLVWDAPNRLFDPKSPQWFLGLFAVGLIGIIVFALLREIWLIFVTAAFIFVYYALARVEPNDIEHRVLSVGIEVGGRMYAWEDLESFSIQRDTDPAILHVDTKLFFPHTLELILPDETPQDDLDELHALLAQYLTVEERHSSETGAMVDNALLSLSNKLPYRQKMLGWLENRLNIK